MGVTKHGHRPAGQRTPTYCSWEAMRSRCNNPNATGYGNYGGRGITVDPAWDNFGVFLFDMGERPLGATLDRIDNNGRYCAENCRWVSRKEQADNRRTNRLFTFGGVTKTISRWIEDEGSVDVSTVYKRIKAGWPPEKAIKTPSKFTKEG